MIIADLKVDLVSYVIGVENSQNESGIPHLCSRLSLQWVDPSTMIGTPLISLL
jgi:hypothetical protein